MTKRVFLYATGDGDFPAMTFEQDYNCQNFYEEMVKENVTKKIIDTDEDYIVVKILEFDAVDEQFITFIRNEIMDYDHSKHSDFFEINPVR